MSMNEELLDILAEVEKKHGRRPSENVIRIATSLYEVGDKFEAMGARDKKNNHRALPSTIFFELAMDQLENDRETATIVGGYLNDRYLDGYERGGAK